jgi:hypothetical protein
MIKLTLNTSITSVKCEKAYSKIKFIKDAFSNTMVDENLNPRLIMVCESDLFLNLYNKDR